MENWEHIDRYFKRELASEERSQFDSRIADDEGFAEEVAFYLNTLQTAKNQLEEDRKKRFKLIYRENNSPYTPVRDIRKMVVYLAAAAVLSGIIIAGFFFLKPIRPQQLADQYIQGHLQTLGVQMSGTEDSMQTGLRWYNEGRLNEALGQFEKIIQSDTSNFTAKRYAGIVCLRLHEYDKALNFFKQLETYSALYANPAQLFQALTLMKRNGNGDPDHAKQLLQQIVQNDLEGKAFAQEWLKKM